MSNLEKAYEMILLHISRDCEGCYSTLGPCSACEKDATDAAKAIEAAGLLMPDSMDYQGADYRPPRYYILDETIEKGPGLGDHVTRAKRLVGPWEEE